MTVRMFPRQAQSATTTEQQLGNVLDRLVALDARLADIDKKLARIEQRLAGGAF